MTTSIIPYEELKGSIARRGGSLADAINRKVATIYRKATEHIKTDDPKREMKIARRDEARKTLADYIQEQKQLFAAKGLDKHRAWSEAIIPTGETIKTPNGEIQVFHIVKRDRDLEPVVMDGGTTPSIRLSESPAFSFVAEERRGKYNDGHMLINIEASSIDRSEYKSMNSLI